MALGTGELGLAYAQAWEIWATEDRDAWETVLSDGLTAAEGEQGLRR